MTTNTTKAIFLLLFAALSFQSAQGATGLLLYTAGGSPYVSAVQYDTFSSPSAHLSYVTVKGGQRMQVRSDGIIANIPYPSSGAQVDQDEASGWIVQTGMFAGRYPQYAALLQSIGELWKRKLETIKVAQVSAPVTFTGSSAQPKSTDVPSPLSEIAVLQTKSGQTFKKVTITRFDGDKAIINYADGIGRVSLSDFGDLSALPQDVKLAIEKATAEQETLTNKKREQERLASIERSRSQENAQPNADSSKNKPSISNGDQHFTGLNQKAKSMVQLWCKYSPGMVTWIEKQFAGMAISDDRASDWVMTAIDMVTMLSKEPAEISANLKEEVLDNVRQLQEALQQPDQQECLERVKNAPSKRIADFRDGTEVQLIKDEALYLADKFFRNAVAGEQFRVSSYKSDTNELHVVTKDSTGAQLGFTLNANSVTSVARYSEETEYTPKESESFCNKAPISAQKSFEGQKAGDVKTIEGSRINMKMAWCPPGRFTMGSPKDEIGHEDDENQAEVELKNGFWIGDHEVTQNQWKLVMGSTPSFFKDGMNHPVDSVSWNDAMEFCKRMTIKERSAGNLPSGWEYSLPTEAQWEYACRAGGKGPFGVGDGANFSFREANFGSHQPYGHAEEKYFLMHTVDVGSYQANHWGIYDMHGNVSEWCLDWYASKHSGGSDPQGPSFGERRIVKGGGWASEGSSCRTAHRVYPKPDDLEKEYGFRVAIVPK